MPSKKSRRGGRNFPGPLKTPLITVSLSLLFYWLVHIPWPSSIPLGWGCAHFPGQVGEGE